MRNTKSAITWITNILKELDIPHEIDGGLAAKMYGATRELADIDINIQRADFEKLAPRVNEYLKFGPTRYTDEHWKLYMMTIKYAGQLIDIGALEEMQYFDSKNKKWVDFPTDLSNVRMMEFMGLTLPFINETKLMMYKEVLHRGVDIKDEKSMTEQLKKEWS
jgi:hypothetical protein